MLLDVPRLGPTGSGVPLLVLALADLPDVTPALLADCRAGKGAHPSDPGPDAIWWPSIRFDEPTAAQWADDISDCPACSAPPDAWGMDRECLTHARAPWDLTAAVP